MYHVRNKKEKEGITFVCSENDHVYWCGLVKTDFVRIIESSEKTETKFGNSDNTSVRIIRIPDNPEFTVPNFTIYATFYGLIKKFSW